MYHTIDPRGKEPCDVENIKILTIGGWKLFINCLSHNKITDEKGREIDVQPIDKELELTI